MAEEVMESDQLTGDNVTEEDDNLIADMLVYITTSVYPKECSTTRKRGIRKKAKKFQVTSGELFYKQKKRNCKQCEACSHAFIKFVEPTF